jgi:hypothetical protein
MIALLVVVRHVFSDRSTQRRLPHEYHLAEALILYRANESLRISIRKGSQLSHDPSGETQFVRVTHPFHPLHGREFTLVDYRNTWGEEHVYFHDYSGRLRRLPASWTSVAAPCAFEVISAGRSHFRVEDLLRLVALIARQKQAARSAARPRKLSSK